MPKIKDLQIENSFDLIRSPKYGPLNKHRKSRNTNVPHDQRIPNKMKVSGNDFRIRFVMTQNLFCLVQPNEFQRCVDAKVDPIVYLNEFVSFRQRGKRNRKKPGNRVIRYAYSR